MTLTTIPEMIAGAAFEAVMVATAGFVLYRALSGRFVVPKRQIIGSHQVGVVEKNGTHIRVAQPGICWLRPGQKLTLVDVRPRRFQIESIEVFSRERFVLRISVSGEYRIADAATFLKASGNAGDALHFELRRLANIEARELPAAALLASSQMLADRLMEQLSRSVRALGLEVAELQVWEIYESGRAAPSQVPDEPGSDGIVVN